jgi:hypothetical protein
MFKNKAKGRKEDCDRYPVPSLFVSSRIKIWPRSAQRQVGSRFLRYQKFAQVRDAGGGPSTPHFRSSTKGRKESYDRISRTAVGVAVWLQIHDIKGGVRLWSCSMLMELGWFSTVERCECDLRQLGVVIILLGSQGP